MTENMSIVRIQDNSVSRYLDSGNGSLFIACLRKDKDLRENLARLEKLGLALSKDGITIGYVLEDMLPYFAERFCIGGTPAYLMIRDGIVLGTLLGKSTGPALIRFIIKAGGARM